MHHAWNPTYNIGKTTGPTKMVHLSIFIYMYIHCVIFAECTLWPYIFAEGESTFQSFSAQVLFYDNINPD